MDWLDANCSCCVLYSILYTMMDVEIIELMIDLLVKYRDEMRKRGNYEMADRIRDALTKWGIVLEDGKIDNQR